MQRRILNDEPPEACLPAILDRHGLGPVERVVRPALGRINHCLILDERYVIRFDVRGNGERFQSEAIAYARLNPSDVPVPQVIALDITREIYPYAYIITTKLPGEPLIDIWGELPATKRLSIGRAAGAYLAAIHRQRFSRFGKLRSLDDGSFPNWKDYVEDYTERQIVRARAASKITDTEEQRLSNVLSRHQALLATITSGSLIHSDYQPENILSDGEVITGIIDFEWAFAGDPAWDFAVFEDEWNENEWEMACPGMRQHIYEGYQTHVELDETSSRRIQLYKLLSQLERLGDQPAEPVDEATGNDRQHFLTLLGQCE